MLQPFEHQVGGHFSEQNSLLSTKEKLYKPFQDGKRGQAERLFYEEVQQKRKEELAEFVSFIPLFYGVEGSNPQYVVLENLVGGFSKPCVMDLKLGTQSWDENASQQTIENRKKIEGNSTTPSLGFRITGSQVYKPQSGQFQKYDRKYGYAVRENTMFDALLAFFDNGVHGRYEIIPTLLLRLKKMLQWAETQKMFRFYGTSVLIIYEGDLNGDVQKTEVRLVDFAHVFKIQDGGRDEGVLFGLKNLVSYLQRIYQHVSSHVGPVSKSSVSTSTLSESNEHAKSQKSRMEKEFDVAPLK